MADVVVVVAVVVIAGTSVTCGMGSGYLVPPCEFAVREGAPVALTALPNPFLIGSGFNNWAPPVPPGCTTGNNECSFNMPMTSVSMSANFD